MKKKSSLYRIIAISLIITLGYIQAIQFIHRAHSLHSPTEQVEESSRLTSNNDISCLICYYLQHNHVEHLYLASHSPFLYYQPKATVVYTDHTDEDLLSFISIRNNKSPPATFSVS